MPLKVGVVSLVRLSVLELPLSEACAISGVLGAAGAEVSMMMALLAPSELVASGAGSVSVAAAPPVVALMLLPLKASALLAV